MSSASSGGYADVSELEQYQLVSNIGKGSFGVISKVKRKDDGREYALKELDYSKMTEKDRKQILAEVAILESLRHRNIVQLIQKIKDPKNERIYIVMEYCTSGDLGTIIRRASRAGQPLHEDKIWNIFLQITLALHHCHCPSSRPVGKGRLSTAPDASRSQVLHRDLKPENVFMSDDFVKLGDFGLSKNMGTADFTSTYVGTPLYMPPEILAENKYDTSSDIWSLGCLVYEMCTLSSPFAAAQTQAELIQMVKGGKMPPVPVSYSPQLRGIIRAMMSLNPRSRPSTQQLLDMPEMQLHKKAFTVQNQMAMVATRADRLRALEERLMARSAALDEREKAIMAREGQIATREAACVTKEGENMETQAKLNLAAEQLRSHWDKLRVEKERMVDGPAVEVGDERPAVRRVSTAPIAPAPARPPLEERGTMPLPMTSRLPRHPAWEDTPSKIPVAIATASPVPLERLPPAVQATPLRRANTKSLGNMHAAYKGEATPAKQTITQSGRQRTSIGSPSELLYNEDITMASMASPALSVLASPASFLPRARRSSLAPTGTLSSHSSGSLASGSSSESINSHDQENIPPTMIPAPTTFVYREAATPAKWTMEDPDLPSPFLRRMPTAPPAVPAERQPLGGISLQPTSYAASSTVPTGIKPIGVSSVAGAPAKKSSMPAIPRSRSGNLHQHVLRANAHARTSGEGVRPRPGTSTARTYG